MDMQSVKLLLFLLALISKRTWVLQSNTAAEKQQLHESHSHHNTNPDSMRLIATNKIRDVSWVQTKGTILFIIPWLSKNILDKYMKAEYHENNI